MEKSHIPQQTVGERIFSWRSVIVILLHLSYIINVIPVIIMSIALVCMCGSFQASRNDTLTSNGNFTDISGYTEFPSENGSLHLDKFYEFDWDSKTRGLLISGYMFVAFLIPQISDIVRRYLGNKLTLTIFNTMLALWTFVTPAVARTSVYLLLAVRILTGLSNGAQIPISGDTLAWWIPQQERLTCATIVVAGWIVSGAVVPIIAGYLCILPVDNGWPLIFYFSEKEKAYILAHRVGMSYINNKKAADKPPYRKILTSVPVLSFLVSSTCYLWSVFVILTCLPFYLTSVLKFSLQDAGRIYSVTSALRFPAMLLWSALGNWLLSLKLMTTNKARKICFVVGQAVAAVLYLGTSFFDERQKWVASVLLTGAVLISTFGATMSSIIPLDMAPRYAGFISAFTSSCAGLISIFAPITVAAITTDGTYDEWRVVWIVMAVIHAIGGTVFLVFGNASLQPWALGEPDYTINNELEETSSNQMQQKESIPLKPQNDDKE